MTAPQPDNNVRVAFRAMSHEDLPTLHRWLREPHVALWWRDEPADLVAVEEEYGPCIDGDDPTELFIVELSGRDVGMMQRYLIRDEPVWSRALAGTVELDLTDAAGMDYLIGETDVIGKGVGSAMAAAFATDTFTRHPVTSIIVNVHQSNVASWRILEKAGFGREWSGALESPDPSDAGPQYLYVLRRP
jgi:aminoglycoside 6'-N-acetyltransferase